MKINAAMATSSTTNHRKMDELVLSPRCQSLVEKSYTILQTLAYTMAFLTVSAFFATFRNYNNEVYTVEMDYLRWVTRVPAFSVCPAVDVRFVSKQLSKYSKHDAITPQNVSFFVNALRPGKTYCPNCPLIWQNNLPTNFSNLLDILTPPCETQLAECNWNGKPFVCCQHFQPLLTKHGLCFSLNSEQTAGDSDGTFRMVTSVQKPEAQLEIISHAAFALYISDRKAVTMKKPKFLFKLGKRGEVRYKFSETVALDSAWELKTSQRLCTLDGDLHLPGFKTFSFSACKSNCLLKKQIELCGCRHHLLSRTGTSCGLIGLQCLDQHVNNLTNLKCGCKHECTGQEIQYVHFSVENSSANESTKAMAKVILTKPPTERTVYYAQTTLIETIVGFACMTRLITTANVYDSASALWTMLTNYAKFVRFIFKKSQKTD